MNTVTIETEWKRRMDLVNDPNFVKLCVKYAQKLGISASEWNANRGSLVLYFANEMCTIENKNR
jgi:hypothetical protein